MHSKPYQAEFKASFLHPRFWVNWLGVVFIWSLAWWPGWFRHILSIPMGYLSYRFSPKRRRIMRTNLALCFPELTEREIGEVVRKHFQVKMRCGLDYSMLWWGSAKRIARQTRIEGEEHYLEHYEQGTPVIFLTCHSLALDFGAAALTTRYPGVGLVKTQRNPLANWLVQRGRKRFDAILYTREDGIRPVVRAIQAGRFFYYLPDEDLGGVESVFAPFFAMQRSTLTTLGRLAKVSKAVVIPLFTYFDTETGGYVVKMKPALMDFPMSTREEDAVRMNQEIEALIVEEISQYMWELKMFNRRPGGKTMSY
jgi:lauroyl-KDO2-lipid IV(A) myristoyltransferase